MVTLFSKGSKHTNRDLKMENRDVSSSFSKISGRRRRNTRISSTRGTIADTESGIIPRTGMMKNTEKEGQKRKRDEESDCHDVKGELCKKYGGKVKEKQGGDTNMIVVGGVGSLLGLIVSMIVIWCLVWRRGKGKEESKGISEKKIVEKDMEEGTMSVKEEKKVKKVSWYPDISENITVNTSSTNTNSVNIDNKDKEAVKKNTVDKKLGKNDIGRKVKTGKNVNDDVDEHDDDYIPWGHPPAILTEFEEGESGWCHIIGL